MESLIGYGSDDDYEDNSQQPRKSSSSQADANYEEVQMDLSEESNDSRTDGRHHHSNSRAAGNDEHGRRSRSRDSAGSHGDKTRYNNSGRKSSEDDYSRHKYDHKRGGGRDDRGSGSNGGGGRRDDRNRDYKKDRAREDRGKLGSSRRSRDDDKYNNTGKDERRSHRGSSRDRHRSRSRSPRRSDYRGRRSSSRDQGRPNYASKRYDRATSKMDRLEKLGIDLGVASSGAYAGPHPHDDEKDQQPEKNRFYMAGITGRFTEQIQRRKLLWQKKENKAGEPSLPDTSCSSSSCSTSTSANAGVGLGTGARPTSGKVWQNTTFAQDTDGKVANKFKRLMGIKEREGDGARPPNELLKKQEEMFTSMEAQYEVARTATHTMRGVGLGFGSFQR